MSTRPGATADGVRPYRQPGVGWRASAAAVPWPRLRRRRPGARPCVP